MKQISCLGATTNSPFYVGLLCCVICVGVGRILASCSFIVIHIAILSYALFWVGVISVCPHRLDIIWVCVVTNVIAFSGAVHGMLSFCPVSVDICSMAKLFDVIRHVISIVWVYYVASICIRRMHLEPGHLASVSAAFEAVVCIVFNLAHVVLTFYSFACRPCVSPSVVYSGWYLLRVVILHVGVRWLSTFQATKSLSRRVVDLLAVLLPVMFVDMAYCFVVVLLVTVCTASKFMYSGLCESKTPAVSEPERVTNEQLDGVISVVTDDASRFTKLLTYDQSASFLKSIRVDLTNKTITPYPGATLDDAKTFQHAKSVSRKL